MQGPVAPCRLSEGAYRPSTVAVTIREVFCDLGLKAILQALSVIRQVTAASQTHPLYQSDEHIPAPTLTPHQPQMLRNTHVLDSPFQLKRLDSHIDSFLAHCTIRSPLAPRNRQQPAFADVDHMIPHQAFCTRRTRISHKRSQAAPRTQDVSPSHLDIRTQISPHLLEDPADIFFLRSWLTGYCGRRVSRSSDGVSLPWEEEDDAAIGSSGVQETHCAW
jgi:hypothetical protein